MSKKCCEGFSASNEFAKNEDLVCDLFRAISAFRRGLNFFKPIIPKETVKAFLLDPKAFQASGNNWYDEAVAIARIICQVASIVCPLVPEQVKGD